MLLVFVLAGLVQAGESDALSLSRKIQDRHLPFGTILDPFLDSSGNITGYTRCGDSAIWTGHYLAAEAYRYKVTGDPEALRNVNKAIIGIWQLMLVTGTDSLARCYVPKDSPYATGILSEESANGTYEGTCFGQPCYWIGNTSRDQYIGVFFGLSRAWDLITEEATRAAIREVSSRLLRKLQRDDFQVRTGNGQISTTFSIRPDQRLSLLILGAEINRDEFRSDYSRARVFDSLAVSLPIAAEVLDPHNSYFKFNLDVLSFLSLIQFEGNSTYRGRYESAYNTLRKTIDDHGNAHFNMIDRALKGPDERRDAETRALLEAWLRRPERDERVDWRGVYPSCVEEERACDPLPVERRVRTDFLWQRSPFLLVGGGAGTIEGSGIDYILPYWMARYYSVL